MTTLEIVESPPDLQHHEDDGFLSFNCPRCGKTLLRYHPDIRAAEELVCTRTGKIGKTGEPCRWKGYVYFNISPLDVGNPENLPKEMLQ